jgi:hypothetical protein
MSFLAELHALFSAGKRHELEERRRLDLTRDEEGRGDPHRGPVDLDSGVIRIRRPGADAPDATARHVTP